MSEEAFIYQCSPTLAGIKTGNLFACSFKNGDELRATVRRFNRILVPKGVRMIPLRFENGKAMIYVYRPIRLAADLNAAGARMILSGKAYPIGSPDRCIAELMRRLKSDEGFPHEIGLFLGYPAEDVDGFIRCKARSFKSVGAWKVYGDVAAAHDEFIKFKECRSAFQEAYSNGQSMDSLIADSIAASGEFKQNR